jgi:nucleoid DNA-binding protein
MKHKSDVIEGMRKKSKLSKDKCRIALNAFLATMEEFLGEGETVQLPRFAKFYIRARKPHWVRSPFTKGEWMWVSHTNHLRVKEAKAMKWALNRHKDKEDTIAKQAARRVQKSVDET